jgi:SAM-dependent methyltransferase
MNYMEVDVEASARVGPPADAFRFGRNWQRYIAEYLDGDRERIAAESLTELLGDLSGKTFVDIGCGSGLFSLCAYRAGAAEIISVDVDHESVEATRCLHERVGSPENWRVLRGSILDETLLQKLGQSDIVYSWGVLHHTGDMYRAIGNAASLVKRDGLLAIAIYNRWTEGWLTSRRWWHIKRTYIHAPRLGQRAMELLYASYWSLVTLKAGQNPLHVARKYRKTRGMAFWTDLVDWLGGYPYEYASAEEVIDFCERFCNVSCVKSITGLTTGNNGFVFHRSLGD